MIMAGGAVTALTRYTETGKQRSPGAGYPGQSTGGEKLFRACSCNGFSPAQRMQGQ